MPRILAYLDACKLDIVEAPFTDFLVGCVVEDQNCRFGNNHKSLTVG
jgi:hypothetical protein